jgi:2-methylisocitrate lyase-like PEP mutase family enzyme
MIHDQVSKAIAFQQLHQRDGLFVIPNPWDAGTARILTAFGYEALATTSAGLGFTLGRRDSERAISLDETIANATAIVKATDLPVSADLENGFVDSPELIGETIRLAANAGLVGGSIEDASGDKTRPIYDFTLAVERVAAAVEAVRPLPFPFCLTARAENFQFDRPDLDDTIRRLTAFANVGADVLYAPALPTLDAIRLVCSSLPKPVNVVVGVGGTRYSVDELAQAGVKRISLGAALSRAALGAFLRAVREVKENGTFDFLDHALPFSEANRFMEP